MGKPSELSEQTRNTYGTVREQLRHTTETMDRKVDELRARVAARGLPKPAPRRTVDDLPLSALKVGR